MAPIEAIFVNCFILFSNYFKCFKPRYYSEMTNETDKEMQWKVGKDIMFLTWFLLRQYAQTMTNVALQCENYIKNNAKKNPHNLHEFKILPFIEFCVSKSDYCI